MKHKINATRVKGTPNHFTLETEYEYVIRMPKYLQLCMQWKLAINTAAFRKSLDAIHDYLYSTKLGRLVIKEISFKNGKIILSLTVFNASYNKATEIEFKKKVDEIYQRERMQWRALFIEHITKNNIKYHISRKV